jgi:hypothetical protein
MTLRTATNTMSRRTGTKQRNNAIDITATDEGRKMLAVSEGLDSVWRSLLAGKILATRVVRVETLTAWCGDWDGTPMTDNFIEVDTEHGTLCIVQFRGRIPGEIREDMMAFVSNDENKGSIQGTWRKRGGLVGHACFWLESFHWTAGRKTSVKRGSKNVQKSCAMVVQVQAAYGTGVDWNDKATMAEYRALTTPVHDRASVRYAKHVLATKAA